MIRKAFQSLTLLSSFLAASVGMSRIAFGEEAALTGIADGSFVAIPNLGIKIRPPMGWNYDQVSGLSMVMQEPVQMKQKSTDVKFRRNITVAAMHKSSPIDEQRAKELSADLLARFGKDSLVSDYKILEYKFFNYHAINDGLMVYTSLKLDDFQMMQMHVLVSGQSNQFLMTYTDFASEFAKQGSGFTDAWNSMVGIDVTGAAPQRYNELIRNSIYVGTGFLLVGMLGLMRSRRAKVDYEREADVIYQDESSWTAKTDQSLHATVTTMWRLDQMPEPSEDGEGMEFTQEAQYVV